jgi:heme/copper-type cytochrome/quinol oxidase subunit 2
MVVSGIVIAICGLILPGTSAMIAFMAVITMNILFLTVYAYLVYRKERANEKES